MWHQKYYVTKNVTKNYHIFVVFLLLCHTATTTMSSSDYTVQTSFVQSSKFGQYSLDMLATRLVQESDLLLETIKGFWQKNIGPKKWLHTHRQTS